MTRELQAGNGETAVVSAPTGPSPCPLVYTDAEGRAHRPILLTTVVDEMVRYAAIAVVVDGGGVGRSIDFALTSALAGSFLEAGDTPGVAAID